MYMGRTSTVLPHQERPTNTGTVSLTAAMPAARVIVMLLLLLFFAGSQLPDGTRTEGEKNPPSTYQKVKE
jgi:hypothetical protein